jgi:hypothetical protein
MCDGGALITGTNGLKGCGKLFILDYNKNKTIYTFSLHSKYKTNL